MVHVSWEPFLREQYSDYQSERQFSHQGPLDILQSLVPGIIKKKKKKKLNLQYGIIIL